MQLEKLNCVPCVDVHCAFVFSFCLCVYFTDIFNKLLNSRKKTSSTFHAMKNKATINEFELSERKHGRTKKVSFLETQTMYSPSDDTTESDSHEHEPPDLSVPLTNDYNSSFSSEHSTDDNDHSDVTVRNSNGESAGPQIAREATCKHSSDQALEDTLLDTSLPFDSSEMEPPCPEQKDNFPLEESSQTPQLSENDLMYLSSAGLFTLFHVQVTQISFNIV